MRTVIRYTEGEDMDGCPMSVQTSVGHIGYRAKARRVMRKLQKKYPNDVLYTVPYVTRVSIVDRQASPEAWNE